MKNRFKKWVVFTLLGISFSSYAERIGVHEEAVKLQVQSGQRIAHGINQATQVQNQEYQAQSQKQQATAETEQATQSEMQQGISQTQQLASQLRESTSAIAQDESSAVSSTRE